MFPSLHLLTGGLEEAGSHPAPVPEPGTHSACYSPEAQMLKAPRPGRGRTRGSWLRTLLGGVLPVSVRRWMLARRGAEGSRAGEAASGKRPREEARGQLAHTSARPQPRAPRSTRLGAGVPA